jgi:hypothetical protein
MHNTSTYRNNEEALLNRIDGLEKKLEKANEKKPMELSTKLTIQAFAGAVLVGGAGAAFTRSYDSIGAFLISGGIMLLIVTLVRVIHNFD